MKPGKDPQIDYLISAATGVAEFIGHTGYAEAL